MLLIVSNGYLHRYGSFWTKFQLKPSILDSNRDIYVSWAHVGHGPMSYWAGGPLAETSRCRQELRPEIQGPVKKQVF